MEARGSDVPSYSSIPRGLHPTAAGVHDAIFGSILKCDVDTRSALYSNIVLGGGSTLFPGLAERLRKEMTLLAPPGTKVNVVAPLVESTALGLAAQ